MTPDSERTSSRPVRLPKGPRREDNIATRKGSRYLYLRDGRNVDELVRVPKAATATELMLIGGEFLSVGTHPAVNFTVDNGTRWDNTFNSDPPDTGNVSYDSEVFDGEIYRCGLLTLNGVGLRRLFKWDAGSGIYVEVTGHDLDQIYTMLVFGGNLYVAGSRVTSGDNVRVFDGSSWTDATGAKGIGLNVRRLYDWGGTLVAVGESSLADGYNGVQVLSGGSWTALGAGLTLTGGTNPGNGYDCYDFAGDLIVVGRFSQAGAVTAQNVAKWNGSAWVAIGDIGDATYTMYAVFVHDSELYVGGTGGILYRHNGTDWDEIGETLITFLIAEGATIRALGESVDGTALLVGGLFHKRMSTEFGGPLPEMDIVKYRDIDPDEWQASTSYGYGEIVKPTGASSVYHQCTTPGVSDSSEPSWDTDVGDTTSDGTVTWTTIEQKQFEHYHGGVGQNQVITAGGAGVSGQVYRIRNHTLPGESDPRTCVSGSFGRASDVYSPLIAKMTATGFHAVAQGLRTSGFEIPRWQPDHDYYERDRIQPTTPNGYSYVPKNNGLAGDFAGTSDPTEPTWSTTLGGETADGGIIWITRDDGYPSSPSGAEGNVRVIVPYAGGHIVAGLFAGFVNLRGKGSTPYGVSTNVVLLRGNAFYPMGERDGQQYGGCLFDGDPVVCGDHADAPVAKWADASTWAANTPYVVGEIVIPTTPNGFQYRCIVAGTSHVTDEPMWPTQVGSAIADGAGALEWECMVTAWIAIGSNLGTGEFRTVADFDGQLWLGGASVEVSSTPHDFAVSTGAPNSAGDWTGHDITGAISVQKFLVANIDATVDKLYAACFSITGVDSCCYVCAAGSTTFSEVGGVGNRVSGEANSITAWVDEAGVISIVVCGGLDVNGTPCSVAEYRSGTWSIIADVLDLSGQALALGLWAKDRNAFLLGGDYAIVENLPAMNLSTYRDGDGWDHQRGNVGGATAGVLKIGSSTTSG